MGRLTSMEDVKTIQTSDKIGSGDESFKGEFEEAQTPEEEIEETDAGEETGGTVDEDYETKFSESTRENQRISTENKDLERELEESRAETARAQSEGKRYADLLLNENPEAVDTAKTGQAITNLQKEFAIDREDRKLDAFVAANPDAAPHREALKRFGRVYPKSTYNVIWEDNFQTLLDKGSDTSTERLRTSRKTSPETGKGSASGGPTEGMTTAKFKGLTLAQQRAHLRKQGVK